METPENSIGILENDEKNVGRAARGGGGVSFAQAQHLRRFHDSFVDYHQLQAAVNMGDKILSPKYTRVKINVGGTVFETYLSTLTKVNESVLSAMVAEEMQNGDELFIDRNPLLFAKVLDYLRDDERFVPPSDDDAKEALRREAEFYNLPELVNKCLPEEFRTGVKVKWKESAIESYSKGSRHREEELPACGERVQINVGGTIFETYLSTLTRFDKSVLSVMVASRWRNQKEIFVDRNPKHFAKVLDYLRSSKNFAAPLDDEAREELREEAEFYNLPGLVEMCSPEVFRVGDSVQWKQSVVEDFCQSFATYWLSKDHAFICPLCDVPPEKCIGRTYTRTDSFFVSYVYLLDVKQHMSSARGTILSLDGTLCEVKWEMWVTHLPQSALRLVKK
ncbi:unnamed protein product [Cylicocyclus nassatus]|uniref:BTB domain-containing protein n=1 Tax=Cylicocyclus nassatus TaxID=53992 RepID=A0AA36DR85_CYLNA|nr:unnamed protein product [Cylicocyclus nassatus]